MQPSAIISTFIKLPFFVLSIFEWPLKTGFTSQGSHEIPWPAFVTAFHDTKLSGRWRFSVTKQIAKYISLGSNYFLFFISITAHMNIHHYSLCTHGNCYLISEALAIYTCKNTFTSVLNNISKGVFVHIGHCPRRFRYRISEQHRFRYTEYPEPSLIVYIK